MGGQKYEPGHAENLKILLLNWAYETRTAMKKCVKLELHNAEKHEELG
jgi:hypothetical protein